MDAAALRCKLSNQRDAYRILERRLRQLQESLDTVALAPLAEAEARFKEGEAFLQKRVEDLEVIRLCCCTAFGFIQLYCKKPMQMQSLCACACATAASQKLYDCVPSREASQAASLPSRRDSRPVLLSKSWKALHSLPLLRLS